MKANTLRGILILKCLWFRWTFDQTITMSNCAAQNCNSRVKDKNVTFHRLFLLMFPCDFFSLSLFCWVLWYYRFPLRDKFRLAQWLKLCPPNFLPTGSSRLCGKHFPLSSFNPTPQKRYIKLKHNAVPLPQSIAFVGKYGRPPEEPMAHEPNNVRDEANTSEQSPLVYSSHNMPVVGKVTIKLTHL